MNDQKVQESQAKKRWRRASELPPEVVEVLRKPSRAINPATVVATVDEDGAPRTAPFGSVRAVTPRLLRMISLRYQDACANLSRDGRVMVALVPHPTST